MKEREEDGQVVMIGASFDEIAAEASKAVKAEIDSIRTSNHTFSLDRGRDGLVG